MTALTLYELNNQVRQVLKKEFTQTYWITAEITEIQNNSAGHCYLQLADKKEEDETIVATARATIWAFTYRMLRPYFETTTGRPLMKGMKVLVNAEVVFHELYGYSLNIKDIDPTFTIGDLERKRREIIAQLESDGIIRMNQELEFPLLPKNIAVISSPTAAGWGDFMNQLENNSYGYKFHVKLFPAVMQGEKTVESVIAALEHIYEYESVFDVVVIIRGGGSQTDLGSFDSYELAANIAQFPLPVIAGIGHERDETIVDRVAHHRVKTPTAAAAFLIESFQEQEAWLEERKDNLIARVKELLNRQHTRHLLNISAFKRYTQALLSGRDTRLKLLSQRLQHNSHTFIQRKLTAIEQLSARVETRVAVMFDRQENRLDSCLRSVEQKAERILTDHARRLELAETKMRYVDPKNVLKRGYSITRLNGKAVKNSRNIKPGDLLETEVARGKITSIVKE